MVKTAFIAIFSAILLSLSACSGEDSADKQKRSNKASEQAPASRGAGISVKADKTHAVQPGDEITLTIALTDFRLAPASSGAANEAGVGHYRIYLDDASGDGYLAVGAETTTRVTIPADINDGSHDLRVVLVNNDESPLNPPVEASVLLIVYRL